MECAIRTIRKINFNMGAIKVEDTKRIRFSNMAKFMFNEDQAIIFNRLNGQWIKVPKQCYDILELCNIETEGGGVRLPPSFLKNDGNASIWIKKLLYL